MYVDIVEVPVDKKSVFYRKGCYGNLRKWFKLVHKDGSLSFSAFLSKERADLALKGQK